jgi:HK97 gp10 family phage protein
VARTAGGGFRGSFKVEGLRELHDKLRTLDDKIAKKVIRAALKNAAQPILHAARSKAPVKSGLLVSTLTVKTGSSKRKGTITARVQTKAGDFKGEDFYGAFQEYGWMHGDTHIPGKGFMRAAYDENKDKALRIFQQEAGAGIEKEAKKKA